MSRFNDGDVVVCINCRAIEYIDEITGYGEYKESVRQIKEGESYKIDDSDVSNGIKLEGINNVYNERRFMLLSEWRLKKLNKLMNV